MRVTLKRKVEKRHLVANNDKGGAWLRLYRLLPVDKNVSGLAVCEVFEELTFAKLLRPTKLVFNCIFWQLNAKNCTVFFS